MSFKSLVLKIFAETSGLMRSISSSKSIRSGRNFVGRKKNVRAKFLGILSEEEEGLRMRERESVMVKP